MDKSIDTNGKLLYTFKEMQAATGIGRDALYELAKRDGFPSLSINGKYYFPVAKTAEWFVKNIGNRLEIVVHSEKH